MNGAIIRSPDGTFVVSDSIVVGALEPSHAGTIRECRFRLLHPEARSTVLSGALPLATATGNTATFGASFTFRISRTDIGRYMMETYVIGSSGLESNHLMSSLLLTRRNSRPQIANLLAPDTLHRPNSGTQMIRLAVTVTDSDGLADIDKVFFRSVNSTSPEFEQPMFDDGDVGLTGDSVANDGRFTRLAPLDSSAILGPKEFRFWARDKSGALSDSLVHFIVVVPE